MLSQLLAQKPGFCVMLKEKVEDYFRDPEHEQSFREWYREKYGHEYEPKRRP